jgi:hypothetical protein
MQKVRRILIAGALVGGGLCAGLGAAPAEAATCGFLGDHGGVGTHSNGIHITSLSTVTENREAVLVVTLDRPNPSHIEILWTTGDGFSAPARAGQTPIPDYKASSGSLCFAPGDTVKTISVKTNYDHLTEPAEKFRVDLTTDSPCTFFHKSRGDVFISDNHT